LLLYAHPLNIQTNFPSDLLNQQSIKEHLLLNPTNQIKQTLRHYH